ncbi:(2Fe-2S)-binding protein [Caballeronia sp. GAFFF1]|uniref:(2Fe-2S)-binding protein n=1 Tax=Caballeronia sp. GAFFF1 TaxID=2921779 RepID=UPI002029209B|nr:(2Fe-2S)-binding protein [Caballeronia sp. GAFFF1]
MNTSSTATALDADAPQAQRVACTLKINGEARTFDIEPWTTLLDLLREHCQLTGTKKGCDHGQCGACTALVDGQRINTCLALAVSYDGAAITTIEGLANGDTLHPMQQAFIDCDAFQCGYCTPGQICSAVGMLAEGHAHDAAEVREAMSGNLCRCGAYPNIVQAILQASGGQGVEGTAIQNEEARP